MTDSTEERLRQLEQRLALLETRLATPPPLPAAPSGGPVMDRSNAAAMAVEKLDDFTDDEWDRAAFRPVDAATEPFGVAGIAVEAPPAAPLPAAPPPVIAYRAPPPLQPAAPGGFEQVVGLKWAGWFGAIVLVVGASLAIRFAYDQGWLGNLPDVVKLLLMSLGGFALLAAGEVVLRRISAVSAVGLYGAGIAVLFLVGYAGYEWYDVYAQGTAFVLMGAATVLGVLVAARADLVSIAVLSLVGGHLVPVVLAAESTSSIPLLCFLLLLQVLALALCYWQATPKWWVLRSVSLTATTIWQLLLAAGGNDIAADTILAVSIFAVLFWALYQAELVLTTLRVTRHERQRGTTAPDADAGADPAHAPVAPGVIFSLLVTAQAVLVLLIAREDASAALRGGVVMIAAGVCLAAGIALWKMHRAAIDALSASLRAQAAALLVLAVPVALDAENVVFGWLTLAIGLGLLAFLRRLPIAAVAAVATWLLAVGALGLWVGSSEAAHIRWLSVGGAAIKAAVVVAGATMLVGHAVATLFAGVFRPSDTPLPPTAVADPDATGAAPSQVERADLSPQHFVIAIHGLAGGVWAVAAIFQLPVVAGTVGLLSHAWLMFLLSLWPPLGRLAFVAAAAALLAAFKWAVVDMLGERLSTPAPTAIVFNRYLLMGLLIACSIAVIGWSRRSVLLAAAAGDQPMRLFRSTLALLSVAVMTLALSVEVRATVAAAGVSIYPPWHATHLGWTMLWTASAALVLMLDRLVFRPQDTTVGQVAGTAMIVVAGKYVLIDALAAAFTGRPAALPVLINLQTLAGAVACGGLIAVAWVWPHRPLRLLAQATTALIVLIIGSTEINRFALLQSAAPPWIVRQAGWSIWWSLFAVVLVMAGFAARSGILRGFGLGLFGLTLLKVVLVDLSGVGSGWRILSFFGLGLLLLGTSVLYGRYGSKLLDDEPSAPTATPPTA